MVVKGKKISADLWKRRKKKAMNEKRKTAGNYSALLNLLENNKVNIQGHFGTLQNLYGQRESRARSRRKTLSQKEINTEAVTEVVKNVFLVNKIQSNPKLAALIRKEVIKEIRKAVPKLEVE